TGPVVVQSHFDFIAHGGRAAANLVALPEPSDLGNDLLGRLLCGLIRQRRPIKLFKQLRKPLTLHQHSAPSDLCWMSREDWNCKNAAQRLHDLIQADSSRFETPESPGNRARLGFTMIHLRCAPPALAVVRLREINQFEIDSECSNNEE